MTAQEYRVARHLRKLAREDAIPYGRDERGTRRYLASAWGKEMRALADEVAGTRDEE